VLLATIGNVVVSKAAGASLTAIFEYFKPLISNEKAFRFAKEHLREIYEPLFLPASYDHVIEACRITHDDFMSFYTSGSSVASEGIYPFLIEKLRTRSETWVFNRPHPAQLEAFLSDFISAYELYFYTHDPQLAGLYVASASREILAIVQSIQATIAPLAKETSQHENPHPVAVQVLEYIETCGIPCDVIESSERELILAIADPGSTFPVLIHLVAKEDIGDEADVDACVRALYQHETATKIVFVSRVPPTAALEAYTKRRGIVWSSLDEFKYSFIRATPAERYVLGTLAADMLAKSYNVHDFYVEPNAVWSTAGDALETNFVSNARPALEIVRQFLESGANQVLFVFGGYGSGKSALCGHLMHAVLPAYPHLSATYIALRQIGSSNDIERVVAKADQLAKIGRRRDRASVVILDGIDEIHNAMDPIERRKNIMAIFASTRHADKIIVTVRTSYFRGLDEFWSLFKRDVENPLWSQMARLITADWPRPSACAMILMDFNTDQIYSYVQAYAHHRGLSPGFPESFMKSMESHDAGQYYRMLVRNPLYMFLILESRPWESDGIECFADILELLIRFWIARDVEKGQSRWLLSAQDRVDFMAFMCRSLFSSIALSMDFSAFEASVSEFFGRSRDSRGIDALILDLQTTGIFTTIRGKLYFLVPAFLDFFVAQWFLNNHEWGRSLPYPNRLPSVDQARLWAGLAETREGGFYDLSRTDVNWRSSLGFFMPLFLESRHVRHITLPARGALYGSYLAKPWTYLNKDGSRAIRVVLNAAFDQDEDTSQSLRVLIKNRRGLHARAAARLVTAYELWLSSLDSGRSAKVMIRREGEMSLVDPRSIMGLMMLGAGPGSVLIFTFEGCDLEEVEELFRMLNMIPDGEAPNVWSLDFGEADPIRYVIEIGQLDCDTPPYEISVMRG
jgi:phosphocarrier protein HPr